MASGGVAPTGSSAADTLKSRYYKYLDALCQANAIDISSLKDAAATQEHHRLELFFGGMPVLVGLKYFSALNTLRLIGQEVASLRPLNDVAGTLEELWLCEGSLRDLTGIENCSKLRKLYLYDCEIDDASLLGKLHALETLWIANNRIADFSFIDSLQSLKVLYCGGSQFSETAALSVVRWPVKLHHLDISANSLESLTELFLLARCTVMRVLNLADERIFTPSRQLISHEEQFAWLSFNFCYLERLNGDCLTEKFFDIYTNAANREIVEQLHRWIIAERSFRASSEHMRHNCEKIDERLHALVAALSRALAIVSKREGRREIVLQTLREAQANLGRLKTMKKNYITMEYFAHRLTNYYVPSWRLEGARNSEIWPQELGETELRALEQSFRSRCSKREELSLKARYALRLGDKSPSSSPYDSLIIVRFFENTVNRIVGSRTGVTVRVESDFYRGAGSANNDFRLAVYFCDNCHRRGALPLKKTDNEEEYMVLSTVTDISDILTIDDYKNGFIVLPLFRNRRLLQQHPLKHANAKAEKFKGNQNDARDNDGDLDEMTLDMRDLDIAILCLLEVSELKAIQFDELNDLPAFDERIARQIRKFRELGIEVRLGGGGADSKLNDLKTKKSAAVEEAEAASGLIDLLSPDKNSLKKNKQKLCDLDVGPLRWRDEKPIEGKAQSSLSLRNPLDLMFALYRAPTYENKEIFQNTVTCLDISEMKLKKLNGVESLVNLTMLNVSRNRISALESINALNSLLYLDASSNRIAKVGDLPATLIELNLAKNQLTCTVFCARLLYLRRLNLNNNRIKSLKGVENSKDLEVLQCAGNSIRDRSEFELLTHLTCLHIVDMLDNPIIEMDLFRKRLLLHCPSLLSINHEKVPTEEKNMIQRKSGKVLTLEYLERHFAEITQTLQLGGQDFRMIALDHPAILKLQSVTVLDLSNNSLEHIYEVIELENLRHLNLAGNTILSLYADNQMSVNSGVPISQVEVLPYLTHLNLSRNKINNLTLAKMGIGKLAKLEVLDLSDNDVTKLDSSFFEANGTLSELNISRNGIRNLVKKKVLSSLRTLNLADNKLKELDGLCFLNVELLDLSNNKISNCAGLKYINQLVNLRELKCAGNTVVERRVFVDFILEQAPKLQSLDGVPRETIHAMPTTSDRRDAASVKITVDDSTIMPIETLSDGNMNEDNGIHSNSIETIGLQTLDHTRAFLAPRPSVEAIFSPNRFHEKRNSVARRMSTFTVYKPAISASSNVNGPNYVYFPINMIPTKSLPSLVSNEAFLSYKNRHNKINFDNGKYPALLPRSPLMSNPLPSQPPDVFGTKIVKHVK